MKRLLLATATVALLVTALALSGKTASDGPLGEFQIEVEARNPWTHLRLNNDPADFRFLIVSDRTGGHRANVFSRAVQQINILQPEFVVSVGDLIEGYTDKQDRLDSEWREFQGFVSQLQMPFFYVAGNHDMSNSQMAKLWKEKFGRDYYHFVYRNVLFLMLDSDDPPGKNGHFSPAQIEYVQKALESNRNVRWTLVFLHRPIWTYSNVDATGWLEIEKALAERPYTVFCGHHHVYRKFVRQGRNYYQLATTGGGSRMRGERYGEFDHFVWVTMKKDGPVLANLLMDGIYREDLSPFVADEPGMVRNGLKAVTPVKGTVYFEGTPVSSGMITFYEVDAKTKAGRAVANSQLDPDGSFVLSTYSANDGAPVGEYVVTVRDEGKYAVPDRYGNPKTSELRARVVSGSNNITLEMKK
ncbi:MAG: metallophosphoesterase [Gemmataceae bacterium]